MIVKTIQRNVVESHDFKSEIATIDANEMRYISSLLRNNYSNTVLATVRETFANAIDANKQTGSVKPVEIKAPTRLDPTYSVRDFGLGLSEDDLFGLYTKYGRSTKRDDNTAIGGFGIGRFAPLSYTDSFTVISRHNSIETVISVYVDEHGDTRFTKLNQSSTNEPSGVEIIVAIKQEDTHQFLTEIQKVIGFCTEPFVCKQFIAEKIEWVMKNDAWGVKDQRNHSGEALVVMGGLAYPLDLESMRNHAIGQTKIFKNFYSGYAHQNFVFFFPVGAVSLHHSRESLEYNAATKNFIANAIQRLEKDIQDKVQAELDSITESSAFFAKLNEFVSSNTILAFCYGLKFIFNSPNGKIPVDTSEVVPDAIFKLTSRTGNIVRVSLEGNQRYGDIRKIINPINFLESSSYLLVNDNVKNISGRAHALLVKNNDVRVYVVSKEVAESKFLTQYSTSSKVQYASKLTPITAAQKHAVNNLRKIYSEKDYFHFAAKAETPDTDFYYLKLSTRGAVSNGRNYYAQFGAFYLESYQMREIAACAKKLNIPFNGVIYGVVDDSNLPSNAIDFHAEFMEKFKAKMETFKSYLIHKNEIEIRRSNLDPRFFEGLNLPKDHIISQYCEKCVSESKPDESNESFILSVPKFLEKSIPVSENFLQKIQQEVLTIKNKYPMIFLSIGDRSWYYASARTPSNGVEWKKYIDLVDKSQS